MGTNFVNPIARNTQPRHHESSRLRVARDSDSLHRAWKKEAQVGDQVYRLTQAVEQIQRELNRLRLRRSGDEIRKTGAASGDWFLGEWNTGLTVLAQQVVTFTPSGGQAGTYVCILDAPVGEQPDTGTDYYTLLPNAPAGVWAF